MAGGAKADAQHDGLAADRQAQADDQRWGPAPCYIKHSWRCSNTIATA